jgi:hypothetical protein
MCAFAILAGPVCLTGCGASSSDAKSEQQVVAPWTVPVPTVVPRTFEELRKLLESDPKSGPSTIDIGELSPAVFPLASGKLDKTSKEWLLVVDAVCGPSGSLTSALAAGWDVTVTGFVDSSGPLGPGTLNDSLQTSRATAAAIALEEACQLSPERTITQKGGVGGDGPAGRKVTVTYTRGLVKP